MPLRFCDVLLRDGKSFQFVIAFGTHGLPLNGYGKPEEYENARATIAAASKFLLDGFGEAHALSALNGMIFAVRSWKGQAGLERQAEAIPAVPNLTPQIHAMTDHLRQSKPDQAHAEALAAMMAGAVYFREQFGADYALSALRELEVMTQRFTELDRWRPGTRAN